MEVVGFPPETDRLGENLKKRGEVVLSRQCTRALLVFFLLTAWTGGAVTPLGEADAAPARKKGKYAGMILISGGPFTMGRSGGFPDEEPGHQVILPAFYIDRNLVTWAQYAEFIRVKGATGPKGEMFLDVFDEDTRIIKQKDGSWTVVPGEENLPAGEMAWAGGVAYCKWKGKRLPSEAEWEKAARGKDGRLYPWGNQKPSKELAFLSEFRNETGPVGQRPRGASPYGVLDMAGQVWEWTRSLYRPYPYKPRDGRENTGAPGPRVARGGNSASRDDELTATARQPVFSGRLEGGHRYFGFRCASKVQLVM